MDNKQNNNKEDLDIFNNNNNNNNNNYTIEDTKTISNNNIVVKPIEEQSFAKQEEHTELTQNSQEEFIKEINSEPVKIQDYKIDDKSHEVDDKSSASFTSSSNYNNNNNNNTQDMINNNNYNYNQDVNSYNNNSSQENKSNPYSNPYNNPYSSNYNNNNNNNNISQNNNITAEQMEEQIRIQKRAEFLEQKKQKRKKTMSFVGNSVKVASCVLVFGVGVGAGTTLSKSFILETEKENFKFDISNLTNEYSDNLILTSGSASPIFKNAGDSVVNISTQSTHGIFITQTSEGSGSGIIYKIEDDLVYIITNNHVIEDAQYVTISVTGEEQISGKLVGTDATSDLAVFSVSKQEMIDAGIENISVAKFANSDDVEVGDFVYPIGNALGEGKTMTQGMISANNKEINIDGNNLTVLQTDAAINPGNSGGALIDSAGLVVGINTAKLASSQIEGIGYAIPSNIATEIADQIIENGYVQRPYFGVAAKTITQSIKDIYGIQYDGVLVSEVEKGSNAEKAGLIPTDIIISFNNKSIKTAEDLSNAIKNAKLNQTFNFEIIRNNSEKLDLTVTFALPTQQDSLQEFSTETTTELTTELITESTTEASEDINIIIEDNPEEDIMQENQEFYDNDSQETSLDININPEQTPESIIDSIVESIVDSIIDSDIGFNN